MSKFWKTIAKKLLEILLLEFLRKQEDKKSQGLIITPQNDKDDHIEPPV